MSDQDNLRDRIEEVIWKRTTLTTDITMLVAQAIIDELELTVESGVVFHKVTQEGEWTKSDPQARIVGKWEVEQ